jgi:hypothetical protein
MAVPPENDSPLRVSKCIMGQNNRSTRTPPTRTICDWRQRIRLWCQWGVALSATGVKRQFAFNATGHHLTVMRDDEGLAGCATVLLALLGVPLVVYWAGYWIVLVWVGIRNI